MTTTKTTFGARTTALEVIEGHDLTGKEAIVTGGSSGLGYETVRALAKAGARVIIATRDFKQAEQAAEQLAKETGSDKIEAELLDLASLKSVHEFSKKFLATKRPLHLLVNNAAVMACPLSYTEDGFENHIGTNHFGHFALTLDLIPALKEGAKESAKNARIVNVSSTAHVKSNVLFDDINFKKIPYDPWIAYCQSKTANVLFSVALTKRLAQHGIYSNALMPGAVLTNLQKYITMEEKRRRGWVNEDGTFKFNPILKTAEQGAGTIVWACVAPELEDKGGLYLQDCVISPIVEHKVMIEHLMKGIFMNGVVKYALDETAAERLWYMSEEAVGIKKQPRNLKRPGDCLTPTESS